MTESKLSPLGAQNIVLIGFMAAGKSSVGRFLARELNWDFLDTDLEIENVTGLKIPELFRKYGEIRFRSEENLLIKKISGLRKTVIATGGGTVLAQENWDRLASLGCLIHLYVPLEVALSRVKKRQDRPLLAKNENELLKLWQDRLNIYNKAPLTIDTTGKEVAAIAAEILAQTKGCLKNAAED